MIEICLPFVSFVYESFYHMYLTPYYVLLIMIELALVNETYIYLPLYLPLCLLCLLFMMNLSPADHGAIDTKFSFSSVGDNLTISFLYVVVNVCLMTRAQTVRYQHDTCKREPLVYVELVP